jgi:hypothetical protein
MDILADVLSATRVGTTVVAQAELVPPWGLEIDPVAEAHVHVVQRGTCWLRTAGEPGHLRLASGDVVLIRGGVGHSICDDPSTRPAPHKQVLEEMPRRLASLPPSRAHETTLVFCAKYLFQGVRNFSCCCCSFVTKPPMPDRGRRSSSRDSSIACSCSSCVLGPMGNPTPPADGSALFEMPPYQKRSPSFAR